MQMQKLKLTPYERTSRPGRQTVSFERKTTAPQYVDGLTMNRGLGIVRPTHMRGSHFGDSYHFGAEKRDPAEPRRLHFTIRLILVTISTYVALVYSA